MPPVTEAERKLVELLARIAYERLGDDAPVVHGNDAKTNNLVISPKNPLFRSFRVP
jgi:hypothetical protein